MKKSELRKIIREVIKEQGANQGVLQHHQTGILPSNWVNRINNYNCTMLGNVYGKLYKKVNNIGYWSTFNNFVGGSNPKWKNMLIAKLDYLTQLQSDNSCNYNYPN
jgi:hypothetical protein